MIDFIEKHCSQYGVEPICAVLPIAPATTTNIVRSVAIRSGGQLEPSATSGCVSRFVVFTARASTACTEPRRSRRQLVREGFTVARCTVERLVHEMGWRGVVRGRAFKVTTVSNPLAARPSDLVQREFHATRPNQLWVADISRHAQFALKVYRPGEERSSKRNTFYREGSTIFRIGGGETRQARALRNGSRFRTRGAGGDLDGTRVGGAAAPARRGPLRTRARARCRRRAADGAVRGRRGAAAPPLAAARPSAELARAVFLALCDEVERMLAEQVLHGDLSPYNVLWTGHGYRIIDFPQAVDPCFHGSAFALLERDLRNVGHHCARFGAIPDPGMLAVEIWERYLRCES